MTYSLVFSQTNQELQQNYMNIKPGSLVSSDDCVFNYKLIKLSDSPYDLTIIGVMKDNLDFSDPRFFPMPVQHNGVAMVRYNSENGTIHRGDPLTSSGTPGEAMKATGPGMIVGVALEDALNEAGLVKVRVQIQYLK
jgi:hypothetical protein